MGAKHEDTIRIRHYLPLTALGIPLRVRQGETRKGAEDETTYWHLEAVLGPFSIDYGGRGYWCVHGPMPVEVAREMYTHPEGARSVRVAGHCGCPPPDEWVTWRAPDGREVWDSKAKRELEASPSILRACGGWDRIHKEYVFSDDPPSIGARAFVDSYHIDTEEGLALFVETVRRHGLDTTGGTPS